MGTMRDLGSLFSPNGRLAPQPFVYGVVAVYLLGVASHFLTTPDVVSRGGLWPFIAAQILLTWIWFVLHAQRLHDAGRGMGSAIGVCLLYVLSVILLLIVADSFFNTSDALMSNAGATSAAELILLLYIVVSLLGSTLYDLAWLTVALLTLVGFVPLLVALIFSAWAATRPRRADA
jgi:uncharacterized membrane protein YhaH (DUF805 family)